VAKKPAAKPAAKAKTPRTHGAAKSRSAAKAHGHRPGHGASSHAGAGKKTARKPLTIKPPPRKPLPDSAVAKAAAEKAAAKEAKAKLAAEKKALGKGALAKRPPRSVAEAASEIKADAKGYVFINGRRVRMISTKGQAPIKKPRPASTTTTAAEDAARAQAIRAIKTKLSRKELNAYRDLLLLKRRQLVGDLHAMEDQALRSGGGNLSHMPIHMADIGTDTFDQDFTLSLAENERQQLREIDQALQRIADGTYGVCQMTGKPIPKARLDAKPWAKYTIEAARIAEGQWPG
jgi:RNA polymerase-binding transcription factor DksA